MNSHGNERLFPQMHLQWFGDEAPPDIQFQVDESEEEELDADLIQVPENFEMPGAVRDEEARPEAEPPAGGDDGAEGPAGRPRGGPSSGREGRSGSGGRAGEDEPSALTAQFRELNENLAKLVPQQQQTQVQVEDDKTFWGRAGKEVFDDEKMPQVFGEAVNRVVGPRMTRLAQTAMLARKETLESKSDTAPNMQKFGGEIEREAQGLIKQYGFDGEIYPTAYRMVMERHKDEIQKSSIQSEVKRQVAAVLKGMGVEVKEDGERVLVKKPKGGVTFGGATGGSTRSAGGSVKTVKVTEEVKRNAAKMGLTPKQYLGLEE